MADVDGDGDGDGDSRKQEEKLGDATAEDKCAEEDRDAAAGAEAEVAASPRRTPTTTTRLRLGVEACSQFGCGSVRELDHVVWHAHGGDLFAVGIVGNTTFHPSVFFVAPFAHTTVCTGLQSTCIPPDLVAIVKPKDGLKFLVQTTFVVPTSGRGLHLVLFNPTDTPQRVPLGRTVASVVFARRVS